MKKLIFILFLLVTVTISKGQPLGDINSYLKNPKIPAAAKLYYVGKLTPHDDSTTYSIIDSVRTRNSKTRPFYLLLVSRMIKKSDGALSEGLFSVCTDFLEKRPNELIEFLYSKSVKNSFKADWAFAIEQELDLSDKFSSKGMKETVLRKCHLENNASLRDFWGKVEHGAK